MASRALQPRPDRRQRALVTPEGLSLPLVIASRGARAGALLLDLTIIFGTVLVVVLTLVWVGIGTSQIDVKRAGPAVELLFIVLILLLFLSRFGYFLVFELGPRGATPGKRALGIRVAARGGGRLTAEAVIARNLLRDIEIFAPIAFLFTAGSEGGLANWMASGWLLVFVLFIFFNKDRMRAGDLIAGTWVVEAERHRLMRALSLASGTAPAATYAFGEAELSIYGEHELQVLEGVLRQHNAEAQRQVMEAICRKIGWQAGSGDERAFLEAFYAALRARLEQNMRFGKRKKDKFAQ